MDTKAVGKRISLYRDRAGMTQVALAERIGCTPQHISAMERGCINSNPGNLRCHCQCLADMGGFIAAGCIGGLAGRLGCGTGQGSCPGAAWNEKTSQKGDYAGTTDGGSHQE